MFVQFAPHQKESVPSFIYALSTLMPSSISSSYKSIKYFYDNKGEKTRKKSVQSTYDGYLYQENNICKVETNSRQRRAHMKAEKLIVFPLHQQGHLPPP